MVRKKHTPREVKAYFFLIGAWLGFTVGFGIMSISAILGNWGAGFIICFILMILIYLFWMRVSDTARELLVEWGVIQGVEE